LPEKFEQGKVHFGFWQNVRNRLTDADTALQTVAVGIVQQQGVHTRG
jgi:hypothetical protein